MSRARAFFEEIDERWSLSEKRAPLRIIGCGALMLQVDYERGTKDSDVLKTAELSLEIAQHLIELAGHGTPLHAAHRMYVELVPNGLPFLALDPIWHRVGVLAHLRNLDVNVLDVVDVVVSKLKRFHADDASDIEAMIDRGLVSHERLLERFRAAFDYASTASPDELPRCIEHLHSVERDLLGVDETEIDLPSWI